MRIGQCLMVLGLAVSSLGCGLVHIGNTWKVAVANQVDRLGYSNWIVIAEASLPAQNRPGIRQVTTNVESPEVLDYVLNTLEQTQRVRPQIYLTREQRALDNDYTPGINEHRRHLTTALRSHETTELEQQSLLTLLEDASHNFDVLVIRTPTTLPYTSVFIELQPGYWDAESEMRLRERISRERMDKLARPPL
ncbi:MAG: hypothetical protein WCP35_11475 [Verrucomicrobiota bacterium]